MPVPFMHSAFSCVLVTWHMTPTWASRTLHLMFVVTVDLCAQWTVLRGSSKSSQNSLCHLQDLLLWIKKLYIDILPLLRDAVRKKRPEKLRSNCWFLLHDNPPKHRLVLVKDFLSKNNVTTLEHPPYSSGLSSPDLHLLSRLKSAPKGRFFCYATEIFKNATEELKRLS